MKYRTRIYYTDAQKAVMWDRWKQGWTLHQIAQLFNRAHTSVQGILSRTGGFRPPARSRSSIALTLAEREDISRSPVNGESIRSIAGRLGRAPSTISREVSRNGGRSHYRAAVADSATWDRALRPKSCKLMLNRALARVVANKLRLRWSPEQIAGWLKHTYPSDETFHVSHETIYRCLFIQARGALRRSCWSICDALAACVALGITHRRRPPTDRSVMWYRSAIDRPVSKTAQCLVTGKETSSSAAATARLQRWSSGKHDT